MVKTMVSCGFRLRFSQQNQSSERMGRTWCCVLSGSTEKHLLDWLPSFQDVERRQGHRHMWIDQSTYVIYIDLWLIALMKLDNKINILSFPDMVGFCFAMFRFSWLFIILVSWCTEVCLVFIHRLMLWTRPWLLWNVFVIGFLYKISSEFKGGVPANRLPSNHLQSIAIPC
jgi:hypothetical protein